MRRMNQTVASLEALGNHLAGIPGRKNMVWISGGIPMLTQGAQDRWVNSYTPQVRGLGAASRDAGHHRVPSAGVGAAGRIAWSNELTVGEDANRAQPEKLRPMTRENDMRIWGTMDLLADVTGGRSFRNTNDLTAGVNAAATDMRGSYSVGFYVPDNSDNRWREFDVRVSRPGVSVLHRKGYMALAPVKQPVNWSQSEWQAAMQNPLGSTAIRLDARADAVADGLNVLIQIAADDLYYKRVNGAPVTDLEIGFGERNAKEWTRVRRDGATITIKENPQQVVKPTIVRFSKMWTVRAGYDPGAPDRARSHDRPLRRAGHAADGSQTLIESPKPWTIGMRNSCTNIALGRDVIVAAGSIRFSFFLFRCRCSKPSLSFARHRRRRRACHGDRSVRPFRARPDR